LKPTRQRDNILEYNGTTGAFIQTLATLPSAGTPDDIEFGSNGNAYVASSNGFYILNGTTGAVLSAIITGTGDYGGAFLPSNGDFLLSDLSDGEVFEYTLGGTLVGTYATGLGQNVGRAVGADSRIYAVNQLGTVEVAPLGGGAGSTFASGFSEPEYLALLGSTLYLTDFGTNTVYLINSSGTVTGSFSTSFNPYGIAIDGGATPEPAAISLLGLGLGSLILLGRRVHRTGR
jgi:DNA-binding beta-propeller fold protein YncE